MRLLVAAPIRLEDVYTTKNVVDLGNNPKPCCLASTRNMQEPFKFCPSCGEPIKYQTRVESVTVLGKKLGVSTDAIEKDNGCCNLRQLLAPLQKEGYQLVGPYRTNPGKEAAYLLGYEPTYKGTPEKDVSVITAFELGKLEKKLIAEVESMTARKAHVSIWRIG